MVTVWVVFEPESATQDIDRFTLFKDSSVHLNSTRNSPYSNTRARRDSSGQPVKVAHIATVDMSLRYMLLAQLKHLQALGYEVCGISAPGPEVPFIIGAGIRYLPVPMTRRMTPAADLLSLIRLYRIMRREGFTIVHTHTPKAALLGQVAARLARIPIIINTVHGFYFHERMPSFQRRFYVALEKISDLSDLVLSQNQEDIRTAIEEKIHSPSKIKHLGNGVDVDRFGRSRISSRKLRVLRSELRLPENIPVVGYAGRLVVEKGILELMEAARIIRQEIGGVKFLIIGPVDDDKPDALTPEIASQFGLGDVCVFTGRRHDMPELYGLMDVLVLPSHREGLPRSPMEASLMGIPSVVTDIRGCREVIRDGVNGRIVPLGDVQALANAILDLLCNPGKARSMGEAARRIGLAHFDERRVHAKVSLEYERLLKSKKFDVPLASLNLHDRPHPRQA